MRFDVLTLFPAMFDAPFGESIIGKAQQRGLVEIHVHTIRDYARDKHRTTDDSPYGGGAGMLMKPEPLFVAVEAVLTRASEQNLNLGASRIVLLTPQGRPFTQAVAKELASLAHLVLICGRYEGVDERVREHLANDELSIGDYVLTGGEIPAMVVVDAVTRLIPGTLHGITSTTEESHASGLLEYPQYTRPAEFRDLRVPEVLLSGDHGAVAQWRREQALLRTWRRRPDLLVKANLTEKDRRFLAKREAQKMHKE